MCYKNIKNTFENPSLCLTAYRKISLYSPISQSLGGHFHTFKAKQHELPECWGKSGSDKSSAQDPVYPKDIVFDLFLRKQPKRCDYLPILMHVSAVFLLKTFEKLFFEKTSWQKYGTFFFFLGGGIILYPRVNNSNITKTQIKLFFIYKRFTA